MLCCNIPSMQFPVKASIKLAEYFLLSQIKSITLQCDLIANNKVVYYVKVSCNQLKQTYRTIIQVNKYYRPTDSPACPSRRDTKQSIGNYCNRAGKTHYLVVHFEHIVAPQTTNEISLIAIRYLKCRHLDIIYYLFIRLVGIYFCSSFANNVHSHRPISDRQREIMSNGLVVSFAYYQHHSFFRGL